MKKTKSRNFNHILAVKIGAVLKDKKHFCGTEYPTLYTISHVSRIYHLPLCVFAVRRGGGTPILLERPLSLQEIRSRLWNPANSHYGIPGPAHTTCLPRRLPNTSYLHCVILSAFTQTEDRSHRRLTAASLIWVNKVQGEERVENRAAPCQE